MMKFSDIIKESSKDWSIDIFEKRVVIFGCGNVLFGDDAFGPKVIEYLLQHYQLPEDVYALDVGTSLRDILFDVILSPKKPQKIIIVDAVQIKGRQPGDIFEIDVDSLPDEKIPSLSLHQGPTVNFLKELSKETQLELKILVVQAKDIPQEVRPGLSIEVKRAIPYMCELLKRHWA